jgi:hypothetical protein
MTKLIMRPDGSDKKTKGKRWSVTVLPSDRLKVRAPFSMMEDVKSMRGSKWNAEGEYWSIENHPRNHFQMRALMMSCDGQDMTHDDPYAWFDRPLVQLDDVKRPLMDHQIEMIRRALTYRYQIFAADMGLGKTLTAFEIVERMFGGKPDPNDCWFVGPRSALASVEVDLLKWDGPDTMKLVTYEGMSTQSQSVLEDPPRCVIFDESTNVKHHSNIRSRAAQALADAVRAKHGEDGSVLLMSGSPTAKRPSDIWSQAEIAYPGFLREGSLKAFEHRYAIQQLGSDSDGNTFNAIVGWKDEEVARLPRRLKGLMTVYRKDDILDLPPRTFEVRTCEVTNRIKRVARALVNAAPNVISGLTALRALSSGFQYADGEPGLNGERPKVNAPCPKDDLFRQIMAEDEPNGRLICFASFQGSIDRVKAIAMSEGWDVITVDGRGWNCYDQDGERIKRHILDAWVNNERPTVLIGNPSSCRYGLTLCEAKTIVVYDQNFSAEHRIQSNDRNYRIGQDQPVRVIDLVHLPIDQLVLDTLGENQRLESLSLGLILDTLK